MEVAGEAEVLGAGHFLVLLLFRRVRESGTACAWGSLGTGNGSGHRGNLCGACGELACGLVGQRSDYTCVGFWRRIVGLSFGVCEESLNAGADCSAGNAAYKAKSDSGSVVGAR